MCRQQVILFSLLSDVKSVLGIIWIKAGGDWVSLDRASRTKVQRAADQIPPVRGNSICPQQVAASRAAFPVIDNRWFVY